MLESKERELYCHGDFKGAIRDCKNVFNSTFSIETIYCRNIFLYS